MSVNRLVSIRVPVLNAIQDMGLDITKDVPTFTRWAIEAEREIGSYYSYERKREVLTIKGCVAPIPCDAASVQAAILGDRGCECGELFDSCFNYATTAFANTDSFLVIDKPESGNFYLTGFKWHIQQGNFVTDSNLNGQKVTIQYLGFKLDEHRFPMVGENHVEAIVAFIMYRYSVRSRITAGRMDFADVRWFWQEWNRLCSHARALDSELSQSDRAEIAAMISDPWIGHGFDVGTI